MFLPSRLSSFQKRSYCLPKTMATHGKQRPPAAALPPSVNALALIWSPGQASHLRHRQTDRQGKGAQQSRGGWVGWGLWEVWRGGKGSEVRSDRVVWKSLDWNHIARCLCLFSVCKCSDILCVYHVSVSVGHNRCSTIQIIIRMSQNNSI